MINTFVRTWFVILEALSHRNIKIVNLSSEKSQSNKTMRNILVGAPIKLYLLLNNLLSSSTHLTWVFHRNKKSLLGSESLVLILTSMTQLKVILHV